MSTTGKPKISRALFIASATPFTAAVMRAWLQAGNSVSEIWCEPGSAYLKQSRSVAGRLFPQFDAVRVAQSAGIRVRACPPLGRWPEAPDTAATTGADVLISSMTLQKIPQALIEAFPDRAVNFHPALLPAYRGPAPIAGMLIDGTADRFGGITLHLLTEGFDEGPVIAHEACPRSAAQDLFEWNFQIAMAAGRLAGQALPEYLRGGLRPMPQDPALASYRRLSKGEVDLSSKLTHAQLEARLGAFGRHHLHRWISQDDRLGVTGLVSVQGAAAGLPERRGLLHIDADLADCRVRLRRRTPFFQLARATARLRAFYRATKQDRVRT